MIDVRIENEYSQAQIKGVINISHNRLLKDQNKIIAYKDQKVILYCHSKRRPKIA
jgi:phage shock protein E